MLLCATPTSKMSHIGPLREANGSLEAGRFKSCSPLGNSNSITKAGPGLATRLICVIRLAPLRASTRKSSSALTRSQYLASALRRKYHGQRTDGPAESKTWRIVYLNLLTLTCRCSTVKALKHFCVCKKRYSALVMMKAYSHSHFSMKEIARSNCCVWTLVYKIQR